MVRIGLWPLTSATCWDSRPTQSLARLHEDEITLTTVETNKGPREVNVITETGLYILVFKSRKPKAEEFTRWVAKEVLPTIRKTGRYEAGQHEPQPEIDSSVQLIKRMLAEPGRYRRMSSLTRNHIFTRLTSTSS